MNLFKWIFVLALASHFYYFYVETTVITHSKIFGISESYPVSIITGDLDHFIVAYSTSCRVHITRENQLYYELPDSGTTCASSPALTRLNQTRFAAVWQTTTNIMGKICSFDKECMPTSFFVDDSSNTMPSSPTISNLDNTSNLFIVLWNELHKDSATYQIKYRTFNTEGISTSTIQTLSSGLLGLPNLDVSSILDTNSNNWKWIVAFDDSFHVFYQIIHSDGTAENAMEVSAGNQVAVSCNNGIFGLTWISDSMVQVQFFYSNGTAKTFPINLATSTNKQSSPAIASLHEDYFVIGWTDTQVGGVYGTIITSLGNRLYDVSFSEKPSGNQDFLSLDGFGDNSEKEAQFVASYLEGTTAVIKVINLHLPPQQQQQEQDTHSWKRLGMKNSSTVSATRIAGLVASITILCLGAFCAGKKSTKAEPDPETAVMLTNITPATQPAKEQKPVEKPVEKAVTPGSSKTNSPNRSPDTSATPTGQKPAEEDWKIAKEDIKMGNELGRGPFGAVYKCNWRTSEAAIKLVSISASDSANIKAFIRGVRNARNVKPHPNVCAVFGACTDPLGVVMEFVPGGSLPECIAKNKIVLTVQNTVSFAREIASGMSHLHAEGITHLDLTSQNLLVSYGSDNVPHLKITDFSLSLVVQSDRFSMNSYGANNFPIRYTAPESLNMGFISKASDVWSYGVTLWELIERKIPYADVPIEQIGEYCASGKRLPRPTKLDIPDELWRLIEACWNQIGDKRPTFNQIYKTLGKMENAYEKQVLNDNAATQKQSPPTTNNNNSTTPTSSTTGSGSPATRPSHRNTASKGTASTGTSISGNSGSTSSEHAYGNKNLATPTQLTAEAATSSSGSATPSTSSKKNTLQGTSTANKPFSTSNSVDVASEHAYGNKNLATPEAANGSSRTPSNNNTTKPTNSDWSSASTSTESNSSSKSDVASEHAYGNKNLATPAPSKPSQTITEATSSGGSSTPTQQHASNNNNKGTSKGTSSKASSFDKTASHDVASEHAYGNKNLATPPAPKPELSSGGSSSSEAMSVYGNKNLATGSQISSDATSSGISLNSHNSSAPVQQPSSTSKGTSKGTMSANSGPAKTPPTPKQTSATSEEPTFITTGGGQSSNSEKIMSVIQSDRWVEEPEGSQDSLRMSDPWSEIEARWKIPWKELKFTKNCLGTGYFGKVMEAHWQGTRVACKFIYRDNFRTKNDFDMFVQEVKMLTKLRHPCICQFLGIAVKEQGYCIVSELMYCSLYSFVREEMKLLSSLPKLRWNIASNIAQGMAYMHTRDPPILHRDLSSKNVLLQHISYAAKVADFGLSRSKADSMTKGTGALQWMAPEVFKGTKYTELCDVYSYAIILFELWTGDDAVTRVCSHEASLQEYALKISMGVRPGLPDYVPLSWQTLIQQCWHSDPKARPSFTKILEILETFPESSAENLALKTPSNENKLRSSDPFLFTSISQTNSTQSGNNNNGFIVMDISKTQSGPKKPASDTYIEEDYTENNDNYLQVPAPDPYLVISQGTASGGSGGSINSNSGNGVNFGSGSTASSY